ncbi:MAG: hypothetical protein NVSMB27_03420 [Ktedonobacteraceae bacterium]
MSQSKPKKAVIYARTDTRKAEQEPDALSMQIDSSEQYCTSQGYSVVSVLQEIVPGTILERVEFAKLRQAMREHQFEVIIVSSFDRISSEQAILQAFIVEAEGMGCGVESVTEPYLDMQEELFS